MLTAKQFGPNFANMAGISKLMLGVALGALGLVPSCAVDDGEDPAIDATNQALADSAADVADLHVCDIGEHLHCHAHVQASKTTGWIRANAAGPQIAYGPSDLQSAYNINPAKMVATAPVVAVTDAYGYASLESDLAMYRSHYGLPPCTVASGCLTILNGTGQTSPLPGPPPANDDWTIETALDVDMVSAACPGCKIVVVQATDDKGTGLFDNQDVAVAAGTTVISNSWGGPEAKAATDTTNIAATQAQEQSFVSATAAKIAIFVSAGDHGYDDLNPGSPAQGPGYPATSAHAIAVGGTSLVRDVTSPRGWSETAWSDGGSACSFSITKPAYQTDSPCTLKATVDIAAVGDLNTGLAVYNSKAGGWIVVGGTSASSPFVAALFAASGLGNQTSGAFIQQNAAALNDITTGTTGTCPTGMEKLCTAGAGWDGPTGWGTPNQAKLAPATAPTPTPAPAPTTGGNDGTTPDNGPSVAGGCSTTGGGSGLGAGLVLALVIGARRRRR
jgi:MYXO-CTERM domain-containing protein